MMDGQGQAERKATVLEQEERALRELAARAHETSVTVNQRVGQIVGFEPGKPEPESERRNDPPDLVARLRECRESINDSLGVIERQVQRL